MNLIDTHAHLFAEEFRDDFQEMVFRAKEAGVEHVLLPNIDVSTIPPLKQCVLEDPAFFYPMMGLHPTSVGEDWEQQLQIIYRELEAGEYIAVGEIGIDLYWDTTFQREQVKAFETQLQWSIEKNIPVSIHSRNAIAEVIKSIRRVGEQSIRGVFHSFGGTKEELEEALSLRNFSIGINGVVTFKNSGLSDILAHCPLEKVVLETDAPYLAPVPYRGKRNESAYLVHIVSKLAMVWNRSEEEIACITHHNAQDLFNL